MPILCLRRRLPALPGSSWVSNTLSVLMLDIWDSCETAHPAVPRSVWGCGLFIGKCIESFPGKIGISEVNSTTCCISAV